MAFLMLINAHFQSSGWCICLNSHLPDWLPNYVVSRSVIACDGAYDRLQRMHIKPKVLIGDFDSVADQVFDDSMMCCYRPHQGLTDFEKACIYLDSLASWPHLIFGVHMGCLDHVVHHLHLMAKMAKQQPVFFVSSGDDAPEQIGVMIATDCQVALERESVISMFGVPSTCVSVAGLRWPLQQAYLDFGVQASVRNRVQDELVSVRVHAGVLMLLVEADAVLSAALQRIRSQGA